MKKLQKTLENNSYNEISQTQNQTPTTSDMITDPPQEPLPILTNLGFEFPVLFINLGPEQGIVAFTIH